MIRQIARFASLILLVCFLALPESPAQQAGQLPPGVPQPQEGDYIAHDFHAVLIPHGTGGSGRQFLAPQFAGVLFGGGQLLDVSRYYVILLDNVGRGKSSKPSDEMHAHFPQYEYDDMVAAQDELLEKGLGVNHLRLILGTSMGCMHSRTWGENYPDFMEALMPLACLPVQLAGRNRVWRKMVIEGIRQDPDWKNGDYTTEPRAALQIGADFLIIAGSAPLQMQKTLPTRDDADKFLEQTMTRTASLDANDLLYAVNASRNYDPSPQLEKIRVPVMFVNSADDFINPPELGIAEREIKRVKNGKLCPIRRTATVRTRGLRCGSNIWRNCSKLRNARRVQTDSLAGRLDGSASGPSASRTTTRGMGKLSARKTGGTAVRTNENVAEKLKTVN